jgi:hypothetical protein
MVKLKYIPGLMIDKRERVAVYGSDGERNGGFNDAINLQGEKSLTLDSESLNNIIKHVTSRYLVYGLEKEIGDAIIFSLPSLLVVEGKG